MYSSQNNPDTMQSKTFFEPPVSKLHNIITKNIGVKPIYEVAFEENGRDGTEKCIMRVTCPISPHGPPVSAKGSCTWSRKSAKHSAALAFMEKFFNFGDNVPSTKSQTSPKPIVDDLMIRSKELTMLESICLKNNFGRPEVKDLKFASLSQELSFAAECKVSGLCIEGKGSSRSEARLQAIVKMIEMIIGTASIYEILKFPMLAPFEIERALKSANDKWLTLSADQKGLHQPTENDIDGNKQAHPKSPEIFVERPAIRANRDTAKSLLEFMNAHKKARKIQDLNNNLLPNVNDIQS